MKSKALVLAMVSVLTMVALAGCQNTSTPSDTTPSTNPPAEDTTPADEDTTPADEDTTPADEDTKPSTGSAKEVGTPGDAEDVLKNDLAGTKSVVYNSKKAVKEACEEQAKMVTDAGWEKNSQMPNPVEVNDTWTQTFVSGDRMVSLVCAKNPVKEGMTAVTMTETENMMN